MISLELQPSPGVAFDDVKDCVLANAKSLGQFVVGGVSMCVPATNFQHLARREFRQVVAFAQRSIAAPFGEHIVHIVGVGAEEKVVGVYAVADIAAMADEHAVRYWFVLHLPRNPMRLDRLVVDPDVSVASDCAASPKPTGFCYLDLLPKPRRKGATVADMSGCYRARAATKTTTAPVCITRTYQKCTGALFARSGDARLSPAHRSSLRLWAMLRGATNVAGAFCVFLNDTTNRLVMPITVKAQSFVEVSER